MTSYIEKGAHPFQPRHDGKSCRQYVDIGVDAQLAQVWAARRAKALWSIRLRGGRA